MGRKTVMNKLTSPELIEKYNPENRRLKNDFLIYLKSIQRSPTTIHGYNSDLDIFFVWNFENNKDKCFVDVSKRDIVVFQNWLSENNKNGPSRIRRLKSALSSLSNYIENILDDEYKGFRPIIRKIEDPANVPSREKTVLTQDQLKYLLDELIRRGRYEVMCGVALAAFSGRRKSELVLFKTEYFSEANVICGALYKTPEKLKTKGRGLGKYLYCYTLKKEFDPYLKVWMDYRQEIGVESEWLLLSKDNSGNWKQATPDSITSWMNTCSSILGVPVYAHAFRHLFSTYLSESNVPDSVIQEIVGWESSDMVRLYVDTDLDDTIGKYFDENGIKNHTQNTLGLV